MLIGPLEVDNHLLAESEEKRLRPRAVVSPIRFCPDRASRRRLANYLAVMTLEAQTIARACGKSHLHNLEPEDLVALTIEAAAMAQVPLAGTGWVPGMTAL